MAREMQKADPVARRRAAILVGTGTVIGTVLVVTLDAHREAFQAWITEDPVRAVERLKIVCFALTVTISGPLLGFSIYLWRRGTRIIHARRFPPPGVPVVRDIPVLKGSSARLRGRLIKVVGGILGFLGCIFPVLFWYIIRLLEQKGV